MDNELISIIIPFYNTGKYLERCLHSVINQTYQNVEIILVNDGSTDNSLEICKKYSQKDNRIKIIDKKNEGVSVARNVGIKEAKGNYIGFVDSDDYIELDMFEKLYMLVKIDDADISMVSYREYRNQQIYKVSGEDEKIIVLDKEEALKKLLINIEIENYVWNKLFKRKLFEEVQFPNGKNFDDIVTTTKLFEKSDKLIYQRIPKYNYIKRDNSIVNTFNYNDIKDYYTETVKRYNYLLKKEQELQPYNALAFISNMVIVYRIAVVKDIDKLYEDFLREFERFQELVKKYKEVIFENIGDYKRVLLSIILWDKEKGKKVIKALEKTRMEK